MGGNKTSYKEGKKEETRYMIGVGIYVHAVCDPQARGLSPSLGCRGRTLTLSPPSSGELLRAW
jgi:hypothetical protein